MIRNIFLFVVIVLMTAACNNDTKTIDSNSEENTKLEDVVEEPNQKTAVKIDRIFTAQEVDSPALFSSLCKAETNPQKCSQANLRAYISENIVVPQSVIGKSIKEREVISFVILPDGSIGDNVRSLSKIKVCIGCRESAIKLIENMNGWIPATKDGKAVAMSVVAPIAFK